ncbi:MAG: hypothetical protein QXY62_05765, partial [Candidatus Altiarchaeota archaeon]
QTPQLKISQQPTQKLSIGSASSNHVLSDLTVGKIAGISAKTENQMSIASLAEQKHGSLQIFSKAQNDIVKIIADNGGKIAKISLASNPVTKFKVSENKLSELSIASLANEKTSQPKNKLSVASLTNSANAMTISQISVPKSEINKLKVSDMLLSNKIESNGGNINSKLSIAKLSENIGMKNDAKQDSNTLTTASVGGVGAFALVKSSSGKTSPREIRWGNPNKVLVESAKDGLEELFYKRPGGNLEIGSSYRSRYNVFPNPMERGQTLVIHTHIEPVADPALYGIPSLGDIKTLYWQIQENPTLKLDVISVIGPEQEKGRTIMYVTKNFRVKTPKEKWESYERLGVRIVDIEEGYKERVPIIGEEAALNKKGREIMEILKQLEEEGIKTRFVPAEGYRFDPEKFDYVKKSTALVPVEKTKNPIVLSNVQPAENPKIGLTTKSTGSISEISKNTIGAQNTLSSEPLKVGSKTSTLTTGVEVSVARNVLNKNGIKTITPRVPIKILASKFLGIVGWVDMAAPILTFKDPEWQQPTKAEKEIEARLKYDPEFRKAYINSLIDREKNGQNARIDVYPFKKLTDEDIDLMVKDPMKFIEKMRTDIKENMEE